MRNKAVVKTLMYLLCCHKRTVLARVVTEISAVHGLHLSKSDLTTFASLTHSSGVHSSISAQSVKRVKTTF